LAAAINLGVVVSAIKTFYKSIIPSVNAKGCSEIYFIISTIGAL
jgi:hypothetical protein